MIDEPGFWIQSDIDKIRIQIQILDPTFQDKPDPDPDPTFQNTSVLKTFHLSYDDF